jgi:hypothetical protein
MKFRPTKLLTTVRPFAASNNMRSAAKSHFAFQPASEFAKTATARASRVAVTLRGRRFLGFHSYALGKSRCQCESKVAAVRRGLRVEHRQHRGEQSRGELSRADKATGAAHVSLQVSLGCTMVFVRPRSSRESLPHRLSRTCNSFRPPRAAREQGLAVSREISDTTAAIARVNARRQQGMPNVVVEFIASRHSSRANPELPAVAGD